MTVERLAVGSMTKRRGRPPKWLASVKAEAGSPAVRESLEPKNGRRFSAATRKKMAEAQRKRWAARKAAKAA